MPFREFRCVFYTASMMRCRLRRFAGRYTAAMTSKLNPQICAQLCYDIHLCIHARRTMASSFAMAMRCHAVSFVFKSLALFSVCLFSAHSIAIQLRVSLFFFSFLDCFPSVALVFVCSVCLPDGKAYAPVRLLSSRVENTLFLSADVHVANGWIYLDRGGNNVTETVRQRHNDWITF